MDLRSFAAFLSTHHGLLHQQAAVELGASRSTWYREIDRGTFEQIHPNVVRLIGSPRTAQQRILAAVWGAGVERPADDPVDIILPRRNRRAGLDDVIVHRPRDLRELRAVVRQGIPCVTPMRMLVDLGAVDAPGVASAVEDVLTQRLASFTAIRAGLTRHARRGHHGVTALREALHSWQIADLVSDSKLEIRMNELLEQYALPPAQFHPVVSGFEVDFLVTDTAVVLECDGYETHGLDRDQFEFDRLRDGELTAAGYVVVHFTWRQICGAPAKVASRIEANLRRWAPDVLDRHSARGPARSDLGAPGVSS